VKSAGSAAAEYRRFVRRAARAHARGDGAGTLAWHRRALRAARRLGDTPLEQRSYCDVSGALIELGRYKEAEAGLRELILRTRSPRITWQATFNLAIALRRQGSLDRAAGFARRALETARRLRGRQLRARSLNLLGNLHLVGSRFSEAIDYYRQALDLYLACRSDNRRPISIIRDNLGYCLLLTQRFEEGLEEIDAGLALARHVGQPRAEAECLQDRCYGMLRLRRLQEAETSGMQALALAELHGYREVRVNCYYLLGEIRHLQDDAAGRDAYFLKLQALYPHLPFLRDFLCAFDLSGIINLKSI
jgi:tetratricopeptide (TPR) repeat protein